MDAVSLLWWVIALLRRFFVNSASHKAVCWDPCYLPFIPHRSQMSALSSRMLTMLSTPMTLSHSANDSYRKKIRAIKVADTTVSVTTTVKSLGVTVDSTLSFDQHVNNVCKAANYHIRNLRYIRRCVSVDEAKAVVTALVSSRLDCCNSVLSRTSQSNLNKLQRVQNAVARTFMTTSKRENSCLQF